MRGDENMANGASRVPSQPTTTQTESPRTCQRTGPDLLANSARNYDLARVLTIR